VDRTLALAAKSAGDAYGLTTFNIRLITVAFGVATIWLALLCASDSARIGAFVGRRP